MSNYQLWQGTSYKRGEKDSLLLPRERQEAIEQRFSSLRVSGNMWADLKHMRQGVEIETTVMARNKLMMNYNW